MTQPMASFKTEPFLWIHLAGIAVVPLTLQVVWIALAIGDPLPWFWLEMLLLASLGTLSVLWMQWKRPFDIFSLLLVSLKPEAMTNQQRRILQLFKAPKQRWLSAIAAILILLLLWQIYRLAPLAAGLAIYLPQSRLLGLTIAFVAFFFSNLFWQVPVSVVGVLLTSQAQYEQTEPYPLERISRDFTLAGWQIQQILPPLKI